MSFASPTSWTDVDYGGTAVSWTAMLNKLPYPPHEMARLALVERAAVAEVTVDSDLQTVITPNSLLAPRWYRTFEDELNDLVGSDAWVDHTQVGGSGVFENVTDLPMWTMASIMTEISDTRIVTPNESGVLFSADWLIQQYKVINLLRWRRYRDTFTLQATNEEDKKVEQVAAWAAISSSFPGQSWNSASPVGAHQVLGWWDEANDDFSALRERFDLQMKQESFGFDIELDVYVRPIDVQPSPRTYEDVDHNITKKKLGFEFTDDTPTEYADSWTTIGKVGDYDAVPSAEPASDPDTDDNRGYRIVTPGSTDVDGDYGVEVVGKYDVTGGFVWKDW